MKLTTLLAILAVSASSASAAPSAKPWQVRAVIVVTFENGADTGDTPGELQRWVEREKLTQVLDFPLGTHVLRTNADHSVLAIVTGMTNAPAASSIMALGLDPRFDLSRAYWLLGGIAGVNPNVASLGSVAWADFVVGGVMRSIDPREKPADWPYGFLVNGATRPNTPRDSKNGKLWGSVRLSYPLNHRLTEWAYELTRNISLVETDEMRVEKAKWNGVENAMRPAFVLRGDSFASDVFWHGELLNQFATDWVRLNTDGKGRFAMSDMEDAGMMESLWRLSHINRVDYDRIMVLRYGSNYTAQRPGTLAADSIFAPFIGGQSALENGYTVGSRVLHELIDHWPAYQEDIPGK